MNFTISPPIRILALVGLIAIIAFGASTMLLGHSSTATRTSTAQPHSGRSANKATAKTPAHATAKPSAKTTAKTAAKTHAAAVTHAKTHTAGATQVKTTSKTHAQKTAAKHAKTATRGNLVYADLPAPLQWQLALHKVVVVSLYNPNADVDAISVAEAHAGALDAKAGFLLVNVLNNAVAGPLTALLPGGGLLPEPGVLVYRAPGDILFRFNGFADRATVSQAAANALLIGATTFSRPATTTTSATTGAP